MRRFRKLSAADDYVDGDTNIGLPYIYVDTERDLAAVLGKAASKDLDDSDRQIFYTLFHEFIHVIQLLVCPVCHLVEMSVLWELFDAHQAATAKRAQGIKTLGKIPSSSDRTSFANVEKAVFEEKADSLWELKTEDLIEGVARMLEERFRGSVVDETETVYTRARHFVKSHYVKLSLQDAEFLDICEVSLRMTAPARAFVSLVKYVSEHQDIRGQGFFARLHFAALQLGFGCVGDMADSVALSNRAVFNNPIFKGYCAQYEIMLKSVRSYFGAGPVFSRIYSQIAETDKPGLPFFLLELISQCGSPIIFSKGGQIVQWDKTGGCEHPEVALGFDAVYSLLYCRESAGTKCKLLPWCKGNLRADGTAMPVDGLCESAPWKKNLPHGAICPFRKVWMALGFAGMDPS